MVTLTIHKISILELSRSFDVRVSPCGTVVFLHGAPTHSYDVSGFILSLNTIPKSMSNMNFINLFFS